MTATSQVAPTKSAQVLVRLDDYESKLLDDYATKNHVSRPEALRLALSVATWMDALQAQTQGGAE